MSDTLREEFRRSLNQKVAGQFTTIAAKVDAVDEQAYTIDVTPIDEGAEVFDVRLRASLDNKDNGMIQVPKVGSVVLISAINNNWNSAFLSLATELEKLFVKLGDSILEVNSKEIIINGGSLGGLIKVEELKDQLNKTNQVVQAMMQTFSSWVVVPQDGGAALKTGMTSALAGKTIGNYANIENKKVKHG